MTRLSEFLLNFRYAFRPRKPLLLARLTWAVIRSVVFRRPPLRYVDFAVDYACNLRCEHCFAAGLARPGRRRMTPADYARVARECMALGAVNFSFQGGEPLLFDDLTKVIAACRPSLNVISVTTNGTLLSEERVSELKKTGVDILTVSLDSGIGGEHDRFRGVPGTFERAVSGIKLALREGLGVTLGAVVTHRTLRSEGIGKLIELAQDLRALLYFILPVPAGRWRGNTDVLLNEDDLSHIDAMTRRSPYLRTDFQANFGPHGCGAAKEILYLTPYGDALPCPFMHISMGNIFEEPVAAIRNRALGNPYFSTYWPKCLVSTDAEFMERYLSKALDAGDLPVPWRSVFGESDGAGRVGEPGMRVGEGQ